MGLGGYLMWTAVAREICKAANVQKVFPFEQHGVFVKTIKTSIFDNNPFIQQSYESDIVAFPMQLNNPKTIYCKHDAVQKAVHRHDKHIIEQVCEFYGINSPKLKCELYFTPHEETNVSSLLQQQELTNNFIVFEPQTKPGYTVNKKYPLEKWQRVVDYLVSTGETIVQVGAPTLDQKLKNIIDLTGKTSFREAACIISRSKLFVSSEGGLMHAANAVGTRSVILFTGFIHPTMTGYPENKNIWIGKDHGPCGMKLLCNQCEKNALEHDPEELILSVKEMLK